MLELYLRTFCAWDQKDWADFLPYAEFCYNNTLHSYHKMTPFNVNFGYYPVDNYPAKVMNSNVPAAEKYFLKLEKLRTDMRDTLMLTKEQISK